MSSFFSVFRVFACLALIPLLLCTASCQDSGTQQQKKPFGVTVMVNEPQSVPVQAELSARVNALRKAEVRPQVNGILQKQLFTEGSLVHEGQSLYKIDPAVYQARVDSAKASLNAAQVHANAAKLRRNRVRNLYAAQAVSQQEWEDADAEWQQAVASVGVCQAALRQAEIDLRYTDVHAPITGRIGKSRFTQGALVTANQTEPLAVIQTLDPIYVDMTQSSLTIMNFRKKFESGLLTPPADNSMAVRVRLETDNFYSREGELRFADISVDESTGMVLLRAVFPNPDTVLLPGMYVRAFLNVGTQERAFLVPQLAVQRDPRGVARLFVVAADGTAEQREVTTGEGRQILDHHQRALRRRKDRYRRPFRPAARHEAQNPLRKTLRRTRGTEENPSSHGKVSPGKEPCRTFSSGVPSSPPSSPYSSVWPAQFPWPPCPFPSFPS